MPSTLTTRCWFELDGKTYGPADCDITEDMAMNSHGTTGISITGYFTLTHSSFPLQFDTSNIRVRLEDKRHAQIIFTQLVNGIRGTFRVQGDFEENF